MLNDPVMWKLILQQISRSPGWMEKVPKEAVDRLVVDVAADNHKLPLAAHLKTTKRLKYSKLNTVR